MQLVGYATSLTSCGNKHLVQRRLFTKGDILRVKDQNMGVPTVYHAQVEQTESELQRPDYDALPQGQGQPPKRE